MIASGYFFNWIRKLATKNTNISFFSYCDHCSFLKIILLLKKPAKIKRTETKSWVNLSREGILGIKNRKILDIFYGQIRNFRYLKGSFFFALF